MVDTQSFQDAEAIRQITNGTCPLCGGNNLNDGQWVPSYSKSYSMFSRRCVDCDVFLRVDECDYKSVA